MKEIRLHGRGGQGAALASKMLATAFVLEGKYAAAFPMFGAERRGAAVAAFVRFNNKPIREKDQIYRPDSLVVIDSQLIHSQAVFEGLKSNGILILNAAGPPKERPHENLAVVGFIDAMKVALQEIGSPVTNTCMMGAFARTTGWLGLDSLLFSLRDHFKGDMLEKNIRCTQRGFDEVKVIEY